MMSFHLCRQTRADATTGRSTRDTFRMKDARPVPSRSNKFAIFLYNTAAHRLFKISTSQTLLYIVVISIQLRLKYFFKRNIQHVDNICYSIVLYNVGVIGDHIT